MIDEIQRIKDANEASVQPDRTIRKLTDEIERLNRIYSDLGKRGQERVDYWVKTADEEREAKEAALLQNRDMKAVLLRVAQEFGCSGHDQTNWYKEVQRVLGLAEKPLSDGVTGETIGVLREEWEQMIGFRARNVELKRVILQALPYMRARHEWKPTLPHADMIRAMEEVVAEKRIEGA